MTNGEIEAALRYWERRRLLTRVSDNPLRYTLYHLGERLLTGQDSQGGDQDYIAFSEAVYAVFQGERKVRPADIVTAWEWVTDLKLPQEVVLMLLNYCKDTRGRNFTFKAAAKLALQMREENITSPEEAESFLGHSRGVHQGARGVLRRFNLRRQPTEDELALYNKWTADWGFTPEAVLAACTETVKASNPSFGYLDGILNGLRRRGAAGGAQEVTAHIARETTAMAGAREVLAALGTRVSPTVVLTAGTFAVTGSLAEGFGSRLDGIGFDVTNRSIEVVFGKVDSHPPGHQRQRALVVEDVQAGPRNDTVVP